MISAALEAGEKCNATVINMRFVKPLDTALIDQLAAEHELLVTIEENAIAGGAGSGVAEYLREVNCSTPVRHLGLPDSFIDHGNHQQMLADVGLSANGLVDFINRFFAS